MSKLIASKAFRLQLDDGSFVEFHAGQAIPGKHADHWYAKAMSAPVEEPDTGAGEDDGKAAFLAMAEQAGVKVDKRWSEEKIAAAIEAAEEAKKKPDTGAGEGV